MGGIGQCRRSSELGKQARRSSRLLPLPLIACTSLVACIADSPTKATSTQTAPSTEVRGESAGDSAKSQAPRSIAQQPSRDLPAARIAAATEVVHKQQAAAQHTSSAAVSPTFKVVGGAEVVLHLQPEGKVGADVQVSIASGETSSRHASPSVSDQRALPRALDYLWWVVAAALILLGIRWAPRRKSPAQVPEQCAALPEDKPAEQAPASISDVAHEAIPDVPVISHVEMESILPTADHSASLLDPAFFAPRAVAQITSKLLPLRSKCPASAPARDVRRARLLLQQGEFGMALAPVLPYLRDLQRERPGEENPERPKALPDPLYLDKAHPAARAITALHADIRWRLARHSRSGADYRQAVCALETYLTFRPNDLTARLRLGRSLLDLTEREANARAHESLLRYAIDTLSQALHAETVQEQSLLGLLGEALCRCALQASVVDQVEQAEAEKLLRQAMAMGSMRDMDSAWWLQKSLTTTVAGMRPELQTDRLNEAIALLQKTLEATATLAERSRWLAALMHAELKHAHFHVPSVLALRLRLRELHEQYATAMQAETSPMVLAAWVELLCAMADPLLGAAAQTRYREVDAALDRLSTYDTSGCLYAAAWIRMAHGRLRVESPVGGRDLLQRAESLLAACGDAADPAIHVEASGLALAQAALEQDAQEKHAAYARALAFARPVIESGSSLATPALRCALKAALALGREEERLRFAAELSQRAPDDMESLGLLAANAQQDNMPAEACRYLRQAAQKSTALTHDLLALWRNASTLWAGQCVNDPAWQANERRLRLAESRLC
jgi:hypothetical protein